MFTPPTDLYIFGWQIHLYSVFLSLGLLAGYLISKKFARKFGVGESEFDTTILLSLVFGIVGARLFYVAGHWGEYAGNLYNILSFWKGGLAFYGALLGGLIGVVVGYKIYKFNFLKFLDVAALGLPVGQAIGRWGNFFNQEAYGKPTHLPWGIYIDPAHRLPGLEGSQYFHPTFFYEFIGLLVIFLILYKLQKKFFGLGTLFAFYAVMSGTLRLFIEIIRVDALYVESLKISALTAIVLIVLGLAWLCVRKFSLNRL